MTGGPRHHAVIGDGVTAAEFAGTARLRAGDRLTVIGPEVGQLGRGVAYRDPGPGVPWRNAFLLNSPSAGVHAPFADWLARNWPEVEARMQGARPDWLGFSRDAIAAKDYGAVFAPRPIFGDFLRERCEGMLADQAGQGVTLDRRARPAIDLSRMGDGFRITVAGGETIHADTVDVATGGPAVQRFGSDAGPTAFTTLNGNESAIADLMHPGQEVLCLGANAAMLDVLRLVQSVLNEGVIRLSVVSGTGLLPEPLIWDRPRKPPVTPSMQGPFETATAFLQALDADIARLRANGATMAQLRPGFKSWIETVGLQTLLPDLAERRKLGDAVERRFRRGTRDSIADFTRLHASGRITITEGRVIRVYARAPGEVDVRTALSDGTQEDRTAPLVVNCTGAGGQRAFDILTSGLIRNGWLRYCDATGGIQVGPGLEGEVKGLRYVSPAVTEVGDKVLAFPLYDFTDLTTLVRQANGAG